MLQVEANMADACGNDSQNSNGSVSLLKILHATFFFLLMESLTASCSGLLRTSDRMHLWQVILLQHFIFLTYLGITMGSATVNESDVTGDGSRVAGLRFLSSSMIVMYGCVFIAGIVAWSLAWYQVDGISLAYMQSAYHFPVDPVFYKDIKAASLVGFICLFSGLSFLVFPFMLLLGQVTRKQYTGMSLGIVFLFGLIWFIKLWSQSIHPVWLSFLLSIPFLLTSVRISISRCRMLKWNALRIVAPGLIYLLFLPTLLSAVYNVQYHTAPVTISIRNQLNSPAVNFHEHMIFPADRHYADWAIFRSFSDCFSSAWYRFDADTESLVRLSGTHVYYARSSPDQSRMLTVRNGVITALIPREGDCFLELDNGLHPPDTLSTCEVSGNLMGGCFSNDSRFAIHVEDGYLGSDWLRYLRVFPVERPSPPLQYILPHNTEVSHLDTRSNKLLFYMEWTQEEPRKKLWSIREVDTKSGKMRDLYQPQETYENLVAVHPLDERLLLLCRIPGEPCRKALLMERETGDVERLPDWPIWEKVFDTSDIRASNSVISQPNRFPLHYMKSSNEIVLLASMDVPQSPGRTPDKLGHLHFSSMNMGIAGGLELVGVNLHSGVTTVYQRWADLGPGTVPIPADGDRLLLATKSREYWKLNKTDTRFIIIDWEKCSGVLLPIKEHWLFWHMKYSSLVKGDFLYFVKDNAIHRQNLWIPDDHKVISELRNAPAWRPGPTGQN